MGKTIIEIKGLGMVYPDGTQALTDIHLSFHQGERVAIIGRSGAGKSTLLRCINRLQQPSSGDIYVEQESVRKAKGKQLRSIRRKIGMIFQHFHLVKRSPAYLNVLHGRLGYMSSIKGALGRFSEEDISLALHILRRVGLEKEAFKRADELSGGQQQRVGIARAIAQQPSIILADEPIASLDPASAEHVMDYLQTISMEDGITTIVSLHQVEAAKRFGERIVGMRAGRVVFDGSPDELTEERIAYIYGVEERISEGE